MPALLVAIFSIIRPFPGTTWSLQSFKIISPEHSVSFFNVDNLTQLKLRFPMSARLPAGFQLDCSLCLTCSLSNKHEQRWLVSTFQIPQRKHIMILKIILRYQICGYSNLVLLFSYTYLPVHRFKFNLNSKNGFKLKYSIGMKKVQSVVTIKFFLQNTQYNENASDIID